jgi:hypothetical protein
VLILSAICHFVYSCLIFRIYGDPLKTNPLSGSARLGLLPLYMITWSTSALNEYIRHLMPSFFEVACKASHPPVISSQLPAQNGKRVPVMLTFRSEIKIMESWRQTTTSLHTKPMSSSHARACAYRHIECWSFLFKTHAIWMVETFPYSLDLSLIKNILWESMEMPHKDIRRR